MAEFIAGRFYRTRDGRKAFYMGHNPFAKEPHFGHVFCPDDQYGEVFTVDANGSYFVEQGLALEPSTDDIIAEWTEPVTVTRWLIAIDFEGTPKTHEYDTEEDARQMRDLYKRNGRGVSEVKVVELSIP